MKSAACRNTERPRRNETLRGALASHLQEDTIVTTLILLAAYVFIGCLFIALAVPLIQGRIKPNPFYGVRVRKTLSDPDTWYAVNAYFGRRFAVMGLLIAVAGIVLSPLGLIPHTGSMIYMALGHGIMIAGLIWVTLDTFRFLSKF
jgi:hypothetical protein